MVLNEFSLNGHVTGGNQPRGIIGPYVRTVTKGHHSKNVTSVCNNNYVHDTGNVTVRFPLSFFVMFIDCIIVHIIDSFVSYIEFFDLTFSRVSRRRFKTNF